MPNYTPNAKLGQLSASTVQPAPPNTRTMVLTLLAFGERTRLAFKRIFACLEFDPERGSLCCQFFQWPDFLFYPLAGLPLCLFQVERALQVKPELRRSTEVAR